MTFRNAAQNLETDMPMITSADGRAIGGDERRHIIEALLGDPIGTPVAGRITPATQRIERADELAERIARFRIGREQQALEDAIENEYSILLAGGGGWINAAVVGAMGAVATAPGANRSAERRDFRARIYAAITAQIATLSSVRSRQAVTDKLSTASGINEAIEQAFTAQWRINFAFEEILQGNTLAADWALEALLRDTRPGVVITPGDRWRALSRAAIHILPHSSYAPGRADEARRNTLARSIQGIAAATRPMIEERADLDFRPPTGLETAVFHNYFHFDARWTFTQFREHFRNAIENPTTHAGFAVEMHRHRETGAVIRAYVEAVGGHGSVSDLVRRYDLAYQRKMATLHELETIARNDQLLLTEFERYHHHRFLHTDPASGNALDTAALQVTARGAHSARREHRQTEAELKETRLATLKNNHVALTKWKASWLGMKTGWSWTQRAWTRSGWLKDKAIQGAFALWNAPIATVNATRSAGFVARNRILQPWRWSPRAYLASRSKDLATRAQRARDEAETLARGRNDTQDQQDRTWNAAGQAAAVSSQAHATHELLQMIDNRARAAANPAQAQSLLPQNYRDHLVIEDREIYDALRSTYDYSPGYQTQIANATLTPAPPMMVARAAEIRALWQNLHPVRQLPSMPDALLTFAHMIVERHLIHVNLDRPTEVLNLLRYANAVITNVSTPIPLPATHSTHTPHP